MIEKYYPRLTLDFQYVSQPLLRKSLSSKSSCAHADPSSLPLRISSTNKRIADEVAIIPSKRLRNKIAGFTTHLMKRIQKGPVRGISFKLQEEERERKDNYVPEVSAIAVPEGGLEIDPDTKVRLFCSCRPLLQFSGRLG
jgi:ribosomal protein S17E